MNSLVNADQIIMVGNSTGVTAMCGSKVNIGDINPYNTSGYTDTFIQPALDRLSTDSLNSIITANGISANNCDAGSDTSQFPVGFFNFSTNLEKSNITQFNFTMSLDISFSQGQMNNLSIVLRNQTANDWFIVKTINSTDLGVTNKYSFNFTGVAARDFFTNEPNKAGFVASINGSKTLAASTIYLQKIQLQIDYTINLTNSSNNITFFTPTNSSLNFSKTVNFAFNISSNSNVLSCELWNNETSWGTKQGNQTRITVNNTNTIQYNFTNDGDYLWNVLCNNTDGNLDYSTNNFTTRIYTRPPFYIGITNNASLLTKRNGHINWTILLNDSRQLNYTVFSINDSGIFINQTFKSIISQTMNFSYNYSINSNRNYRICGLFWINNSGWFVNNTLTTDTGACFIVNNSKSTTKNINISTQNLTPNYPISTSNLSCNFTSNDDDPIDTNNLTITYDWEKGGLSQSINYSTLFSSNLTNGDLWSCSIVTYDGIENSSKNWSNNVTIGDNINPNINFTESDITTVIVGNIIRFNTNISDADSSIDYVRIEVENSGGTKINHSMVLIEGINAPATRVRYEYNFTAPNSPTGTNYVKFWVVDTSGNIGNSSNRNLSFIINPSSSSSGGTSSSGGGGGGAPPQENVLQDCNIKIEPHKIVINPNNKAYAISINNFHTQSVIPDFNLLPTNTSEDAKNYLSITKGFTDVLSKDTKTFVVVANNFTGIIQDVSTTLKIDFKENCQSKYVNITITPTPQETSFFNLNANIGNLTQNTKTALTVLLFGIFGIVMLIGIIKVTSK